MPTVAGSIGGEGVDASVHSDTLEKKMSNLSENRSIRY